MSDHWLQAYLDESVHKKVCTKISCTTCGARQFRLGLLNALSHTTGHPSCGRFDQSTCLQIANALSEVNPDGDVTGGLEDAVRFILCVLWDGIPNPGKVLETVLKGTWAGNVLDRMIEYHESVEALQRNKAAYESPQAVADRKEKKKRLKQEQHAKRLEAKIIHDKVWRERNMTDNSS